MPEPAEVSLQLYLPLIVALLVLPLSRKAPYFSISDAGGDALIRDEIEQVS